jgi:hypothetical protein
MPIYFHHVPSTGGTSMWQTFQEVYGSSLVARMDSTPSNWSIGKKLNMPLEEYKVIGGHFPPHFFGFSVEDFHTHIIFFRCPLRRALSVFKRKVLNGKYHVNNVNLEDAFIKFIDDGHATQRFEFTQIIGEKVTVKECMNVLSSRYTHIGLTDNYNQSLAYFAHTLGWCFVPRPSLMNTSDLRKKRNGKDVNLLPTEKIRKYTKKKMEIEYTFYEAAKMIFKRQLFDASGTSKNCPDLGARI